MYDQFKVVGLQLYLKLIELEQVRVHDSRGSDDSEEAALL